MSAVAMVNCDLVALIDEEDAALVAGHRWSAYMIGRTHYAMSEDGNRRRIYMHRLIAGLPGLEVDHRNGDGLDNRRSNLRSAPHALNLANQRSQLGRMSQFKGVSRNRHGNWYAYIKVDQKKRHLGTYGSETAAAAAYNAAAIAAWGEFARLNVIPAAA